ncbi:MAG: LysR family transcriptional regulator [Rhodopila sp.]
MRAPGHLKALRAVEAAARHQSFALAAQEPNVTPATVGQLVRRLEETLGVELFHRSQAGPARLVVTEAATSALLDLQAGFAHLSAAMDRLRSARKRQTLAVTVPMAFADKWLLHRLGSFRRGHPGCELRIDTSTALVDFATQPVDVGIRYGAGVWPGLVAVFFASTAFPVSAPPVVDGGAKPAMTLWKRPCHRSRYFNANADEPGHDGKKARSVSTCLRFDRRISCPGRVQQAPGAGPRHPRLRRRRAGQFAWATS